MLKTQFLSMTLERVRNAATNPKADTRLSFTPVEIWRMVVNLRCDFDTCCYSYCIYGVRQTEVWNSGRMKRMCNTPVVLSQQNNGDRWYTSKV